MIEHEMKGVREYAEGMQVNIAEEEGLFNEDAGGPARLVIKAWNQGGSEFTCVDLEDVIDWVKEHAPKMLK